MSENIIDKTQEIVDGLNETKSELTDAIESKGVNIADGTELDSYAAAVAEITTGELPEVQPEDYITKEILDQILAAKNYITDSDLEKKNYITDSDLEEKGYITDSDLEKKGYITEDDIPPDGLPIGMTFDYYGDYAPHGAYILNGQWVYNCRNSYPEFFAFVQDSSRTVSNDVFNAAVAEKGYCNEFVINGNDVRLPMWQGYQMPLPDYVGCRNNPESSALKLICSKEAEPAVLLYNYQNAYLGPIQKFWMPNGTDWQNAVDVAFDIGPITPVNSLHPQYADGTYFMPGLPSDPDKSGVVADFTRTEKSNILHCIQVFNSRQKSGTADGEAIVQGLQNKMDKDFSNAELSLSAKEKISGLMIPDYTQSVIVYKKIDYDVNEHTWTAPSAGVINVCLASYNYWTYLYIDGTVVAETLGREAYVSYITGQYIVKKGTKVRFKSGIAHIQDGIVAREKILFSPFAGQGI